MDYAETNKAVYDALADEFRQKKSYRLKADTRLITVFTDSLSERFSQPSVLDIGPGNGNMAKLLLNSGCEVTAIDISPKMAEVAKENCPGAKVITGDFLNYDFGPKKFSGILACAFIHLLDEPELTKSLAKMKAVLEDGGLILISTTKHNKSSEGFEAKSNFSLKVKRFRRRFTEDELMRILDQNGFLLIKYWENADGEEWGKIWMNFIVEGKVG